MERLVVRPLLLAAALVMAACSSGDGADEPARDTGATSTSMITATTATASSTTAGSPTASLRYGEVCPRGSHRDCVDPEGDGEYTYLKGGGDCLATFRESPGLCSDLDGNGEAGYPDSG